MVKVLVAGIVSVVLIAAGIFALRSWVGLDEGTGADAPSAQQSSAAPQETIDDAEPTPSPSPSESPTPTPSPTPDEEDESSDDSGGGSAPTTPTVSTAAAVRSITVRLNATGPDVSVWCPPRVAAQVGTRFTCPVAYASQPGTVVADAAVVISPSGQFRWVSNPR